MNRSLNHIRLLTVAVILTLWIMIGIGCRREPILYLHEPSTGCYMDLPMVDLELDVYWDYELAFGINYDWRSEWYYGWDDEDLRIFGPIGYAEPTVFNIRRYHTGNVPYAPHTSVYRHTIEGTHLHTGFDFGFWDILAWNDINTIDGVQSLIFDEESSLDNVVARTNQTMHVVQYKAQKYEHSFYEPEALFAGYDQGIEISQTMKGFIYDSLRNVWVKTLNMMLEPVTYIYLTQVIIHHNRGRIAGVEGSANLSSMARSVCLNNGVAGCDAITVNYGVRMKHNCRKLTEDVDIIGGRLMTFGHCNINANRITRADELEDKSTHYMDLNLQFNNGMDSTFVFNVTDQVRKRYKGGVITVELDMDTISIPSRSGGSGFDAVVKDFDEEEYQIDM